MILDKLLALGAEKDAVDDQGYDAVLWAIRGSPLEVVALPVTSDTQRVVCLLYCFVLFVVFRLTVFRKGDP